MNHQAFLLALRDNPDDDIQRLVFADWLEEHGQPERAEFIRIQVELQRGVRDRGRSLELLRQLRALMVEYRSRWLGELADITPDAVFERGFVCEISLAADDFLDRADQILAEHPITRLRLVKLGKRIHDVAACPHLALMTGLDLSGNPIDDTGVVALASSPFLSRLKTLELQQTGIGTVGVAALVSSQKLAGLTTLGLRGNQIGDEGVEALVQFFWLPQLTRLDLSENGISERGAERLADAPALRSLTALLLRLNPLGTRVERLATSPNLAGLSVLDVTFCISRAEGQQLRRRYGPRIVA